MKNKLYLIISLIIILSPAIDSAVASSEPSPAGDYPSRPFTGWDD